MTISSSQAVVICLGNGLLTEFDFTFPSPSVASNISVIYTDADGNETTLTSSQYTLVFNNPTVGQIWGLGGTVTYPISGTPIANGTTITIVRVVPYLQTTSLTNQGAFAPIVVEGALDKLAMQIEQVYEITSRSPQVPITFQGSTPQLIPPFTQGYVATFDSNGNIVASPAGSGGGGGGGSVTSVGTGTGLTGGPITSAGTIAMAVSTINSLAGYNNSGVFSNVAIGSGLSLSGGTLSATGAVTSVSNSDGTLTISPTTGAVVVSLAALTSGRFLIGNGSNLATERNMSGDATMTNTGAVTVTKTNGTDFGTMAVQDASAVAITGGTITGMPTPTNGSDVATKSYVDGASSGLNYKGASVAATTTALTATYSNGASGVGATLTNSGALAAFSTDGVSPAINSVILVKNQATPAQNGLYTLTTVGSGAAAWVLTRATNYDQAADIAAGDYTIVQTGSTLAGTLWIQTTEGPFTVGTTDIVFDQYNIGSLTLTLTGDVTGTGSGTIATTIANNAVTTAKVLDGAITGAKMSTSSANTLAGYNGAGVFSGVTLGTYLTLAGGILNASGPVASVTAGDSTLTITPTTGAVVAIVATGGITATQLASNAVTTAKILNNNVTLGKLATGTANSLLGYDGSANAAVITRTATSNLVITGSTISINATIFNVKDYGALGDGSTNDNTAFTNCVAAANSAGGGVIYIPTGTYILTTSFTTTGATYLKGEGQQLSVLKWTTAGGFVHNGGGTTTPTGRKTFFASGITFVAAFAGGATCLDINYTVVSGSVSKLVTIEACEFTRDGSSNYWDRAIDMENARSTDILLCSFRGLQTSRTMEGIRINGANDPVEHRISSCEFYFLNNAIEVGGTVEGVYIDAITAVACNVGVRWNTSGGEPLLSIMGSHFSTYNYNLRLTNCIQAMFQNCLFYERSDTAGTNTGIQFESGCDDVLVQGNIFRGFTANDFNAVVVASGSSDIKITNNSFTNAATGINFRAGSSQCSSIENDFNSSTIQDVLDNGSIDKVVSNLAGFGALIYMTGSQAISNNTWTVVNFGAANYDPLTLWNSSSRLTVPAGVKKVRLSGNMEMAAVTSGTAFMTIIKNGVSFLSDSYVGQPHIGGGNNTALNGFNCSSAVLSVSAGDYFEMQCFQSSGSSKDIAQTNTKNQKATWLCMEILG